MNDAHDGPDSPPSPVSFAAVPLFPLPNVVLFPGAVLPLHIFEERYKVMTADTLRGDRLVAMALLRPGWERDYYHKPLIEPVVCVGRILQHERLPDGKYNFLLQGQARARVVKEIDAGDTPYRLAELARLTESTVADAELNPERERMQRLFLPGRLGASRLGRQFRALLGGGQLHVASLADLVAFAYFDDARLKQSLLEECDVRRRVERTIEALEVAWPALRVASLGAATNPVSLN